MPTLHGMQQAGWRRLLVSLWRAVDSAIRGREPADHELLPGSVIARLAATLHFTHTGVGTLGAVAEDLSRRQFSRISFLTSGSTGVPQTFPHEWTRLQQEVTALAAWIGPRQRVLAAVPAHHIYGFLFTLLLPEWLGAAVVDVKQLDDADLIAFARAGDLLISFPQHWARLAARHAPWLAGVLGISSTGPCPASVLHALSIPVWEVYGSTETAGIGTRESPDCAYELLAYWQRDGERLQRHNPDGTSSQVLPPDELEWLTERSFLPLRRRDGAVQVAGINVYPERVAGVLRGYPGVIDAAVRLADKAGRLKAFIVGANLDEAVLRAWVQEQLSGPERPALYRFGSALPRDEYGKLRDW